jgi:RecB family exonuclease
MDNVNTCELRYFYEYILKYRGEGGVKTVMGSAIHCVAESLARVKLNIQNGSTDFFIEMDDIGRVDYNPETWMTPRTLSDIEVDTINKNRKNKSNFKDQNKIEYGAVRHGEALVEELIERAFQHYELPRLIAEAKEKGKKDPFERNYREYSWMLFEQFDPRVQNVVDVEFDFELPLPYEWAKDENGDYIKLKGFIDLITEPEPGVLVITDYKTGERVNFPSFETKTYRDIKKDLQLSMYCHALQTLFPDKMIIANLFFVRDGGVFSVTFDANENAVNVNQIVEEHLEKVRGCVTPTLLSPVIATASQETIDNFQFKDTRNGTISSACMYLCPAFKSKQFGSDCDCKFLSSKIAEIGMDAVEEQYKKGNFEV